MSKPRLFCTLRFPKDSLDHKQGELRYVVREGTMIVSRGEFVVAGPDGRGLFEVFFDPKAERGEYQTRLCLGQGAVDKLVFPETSDTPITCNGVLQHGLDLRTTKA